MGAKFAPKLTLEENLDRNTGGKRKSRKKGEEKGETPRPNDTNVDENTTPDNETEKPEPKSIDQNSPPKKRSKFWKNGKVPSLASSAPAPPIKSKCLTVKEIISKMKGKQ